MTFSFANRKVLVTGAAGGLGHAIVKKFYESGATVFAIDIHEDRLNSLKNEFPNICTIVADLTKWDETRKTISTLGPMHHLVNNAGIGLTPSCLEATEDDIDKTFNLNFKAAMNLSQIFAKSAIDNGIQNATIVNVSSIAGMSPLKEFGIGPIYPCSKAAVNMLTKCFAIELGALGIRVNSVNPNLMNTYMVDSLSDEAKAGAARVVERTPMSQVIETADTANLILYLSSDSSKMITGSNVPIDGGYLAC